MTRRFKSDDVLCAACGQPIDETHRFFVHTRGGEKGEYKIYHSECLKLVGKQNKTNDKKTFKNA